MQYLVSKKSYLKQSIRISIDSYLEEVFLRVILKITRYQSFLNFSDYVDRNGFSKYDDIDSILEKYQEFLTESFIVITSSFFREVYSCKSLKYTLFFKDLYSSLVFKKIKELERYEEELKMTLLYYAKFNVKEILITREIH